MTAARVVLLLALLTATVAVFVMVPGIDIVFVTIGLALGWLAVAPKKRLEYLLATLALGLTVDALDPLPLIGLPLTLLLSNLSAILNAGAIVVLARSLAAMARNRA